MAQQEFGGAEEEMVQQETCAFQPVGVLAVSAVGNYLAAALCGRNCD